MKVTRRLNFHWADLEMSEIELEKLISHFALSNRSEGKSPKTEAWYTEMLSDFVRWPLHNGRSTTLTEFSVMNVREFVIYMQERNLSPYTVQGHVGSLKAFDSWLFNEGYITDKVLARFKKPKVPKKFVGRCNRYLLSFIKNLRG